MSTRIYNLSNLSAPVPGPSFTYTRDADGKTVGRHTFTVVRGAMALAATQAYFKKGTPITAIDPTLPPSFAFLLVDSHEAQDRDGGLTEVSVALKGYTESGEFGTDREITYSGLVNLKEESIFEHPKYIAQVRQDYTQVHAGISACVNGTAYVKNPESNSPQIIMVVRDVALVTISDDVHRKWFRRIVLDGVRTWLSPSYEWTRATANVGGLSNSDLAKLGKIDAPPGGPPKPGFTGKWLLFSASESRSGDSASTEMTWSYGNWDTDLYDE